MAAIETYSASVPDWATQVEFVVHEPSGVLALDREEEPDRAYERDRGGRGLGTFRLISESEIPPLFLIAVLSTPNGLFPTSLDASIQLTDPRQRVFPAPDTISDSVTTYHDTRDLFVSPDARLIIIHNPSTDDWDVAAKDGVSPYAVTVMAFHPAELPNSPPSPGSTGGSPFKCRACKTTAKGLALAIVAAAVLHALPAALIIAVGKFLGVASPIAAAFIQSVIGDTVDVIAEKLCRKIGLC
jgi:hypothetical protein